MNRRVGLWLKMVAFCLFAAPICPAEIVVGQEDETSKPKEVKKFDPKVMVGQWVTTAGQRGGAKTGPDRLPPKVNIDSKQFVFAAGPGQEFVMSYKLDASKSPIAIDIQIESGPAPSISSKGIVMIKGDTMKLCYDPSGDSRPETFQPTDENGLHMFEFKRAAKELSAKALEGQWKYVSGKRAGEAVAKDRLAMNVKVKDGKFTIPTGAEDFVMSFKIDAKKSPATIDMKIESGPAGEGEAVGIIKMEGDKFVLCYDAYGSGKRPTEFDSTQENGFFMFTLERMDDDDDDDDDDGDDDDDK